MITSVDTSVLSDIFLADPAFVEASAAALEGSLGAGSVVACEVVLAEFASALAEPDAAAELLRNAGIGIDSIGHRAALSAGAAWKQYRARGGSRERLIPDFLIAAHASERSDRLLTRDPRVPRRYFPALPVLNPTESA